MTNRRQLIASFGALAALAAAKAWSQTSTDFGLPQLSSTPFRRIRVGDAEVVALQDGATRLPLHERYVTNAPFAQVKALLSSLQLSTDFVELPFTGFLIVLGERRILLDSGLGEFGSPSETTGRLVSSLRAAGFAPQDIDTVLISHFHADHISGLRDRAGLWTYPNAKILVPAPEYAYWMDDANLAAAPARKAAFDIARRVFADMPPAMLARFDPGQEVVPGIRSVAAYGHTPGHTTFELRSAGQTFNYIADMINVPALFTRHPEWSVASDMDADAARQVRLREIARIADARSLVGGFHFPFPAVGHLLREAAGYRFQPVA